MIKYVFSPLFLVFLLSGCVGYVGGDLKSTSLTKLEFCEQNETQYRMVVESNASDDYANRSLAGRVSSYSFGLIPTYSKEIIHSRVVVYDGETKIYEDSFITPIKKFYGILWVFFLSNNIDSLPSDEGEGIRIPWGIRDRIATKVVESNIRFLDASNMCLEM